MNNCDKYDYTQQLPQLTFFQGDEISIPLEWVDDNGLPIDLSNFVVEWKLCPYGYYDSPVLTYSSNDIASKITFDSQSVNICYINIPSTDSTNLSDGKYIQQPFLTQAEKKWLRAEGEIIFRREID